MFIFSSNCLTQSQNWLIHKKNKVNWLLCNFFSVVEKNHVKTLFSSGQVQNFCCIKKISIYIFKTFSFFFLKLKTDKKQIRKRLGFFHQKRRRQKIRRSFFSRQMALIFLRLLFRPVFFILFCRRCRWSLSK